jgi:glyoxylase-like metal-dependent hydrolase (beta-lactamase superfamily II)
LAIALQEGGTPCDGDTGHVVANDPQELNSNCNGARAMTHYKIHPIVLGTKVFDKGMMTYQHHYGREFVIPIYAWYLEGGDQTILVDTGEMSPIQSPERESAIGGKIYTFEEGLARWGLTPDAIDVVIHTHLHNDHCENDYKCRNAVIYAHAQELAHIHDPHPLDFRYLEDYIEDVEENGQLRIVSEDREVLPGIRLMHTPVHTEGGLSVIVDTAEGRAVITGFCVIEENFFPPKEIRAMEMDVIPPGTPVNVYRAYDIMQNVKAMADILIPLHEPKFASVETISA